MSGPDGSGRRAAWPAPSYKALPAGSAPANSSPTPTLAHPQPEPRLASPPSRGARPDVLVVLPQGVHRLVASSAGGAILTLTSGHVIVLHASVLRLASRVAQEREQELEAELRETLPLTTVRSKRRWFRPW